MVITEINEATAQMLVIRPVFMVKMIYEGSQENMTWQRTWNYQFVDHGVRSDDTHLSIEQSGRARQKRCTS